MTDTHNEGDPVPEVFTPTSPAARFVVAMAMARNDIDIALRDVYEAGTQNRPEFKYRVRVLTGHLAEALDSLRWYRQEHAEVRELLKRLSNDGRPLLKVLMGALQESGVLEQVRDGTFHYPSPDPAYAPTSDDRLAGALAVMTDHAADIHVDDTGEHTRVSMSFADEAAFRLATGILRPNDDIEGVEAFAESSKSAAIAFHTWFDHLFVAYHRSTGIEFGEPILVDEPPDS